MGWSSWYAFGPSVNQSLMAATFRKLANRSVVRGDSRSLKDVGYVFANLDDGWQACGGGESGSFHDAAGEPVVDRAKFPNISAMTAQAHSMGLFPGFYVNNYICSEGTPPGGVGGSVYMRNMNGTVGWLARNGFDYVKVDSGGAYNDMQLWSDLIAASGRPMVVENCHQGHLEPNSTWCPFDLFRTSGDGHVVGLDVELLASAAVLNLARPGCWAYPDTLDAGTAAQARSQFGPFAVMSAPLVLSFDILDDERLLPVWDVLTNEEAISVNQRWGGSAGALLRKWAPHAAGDPLFPWAEPCLDGESSAQRGWSYNETTGQVAWAAPQSEGPAPLCVASDTAPLSLRACQRADGSSIPPSPPSPPSSEDPLRWVLRDGRLWQGVSEGAALTSPITGDLRVEPCNASRPGQRWRLSAVPGRSEQAAVQNDLSFRAGGCWEITACAEGERAEVGVSYGCKPMPRPGWTDPCEANGAWSFNANLTITSVMDGKCLQVDPQDDTTVSVASCNGEAAQRWRVEGATIRRAERPDLCVSSGVVAPPPGTTGRCAALVVTDDAGGAGAWSGLRGPALGLDNAERCLPDSEPPAEQSFGLGADGALRVGALCAAARRGSPTAFGPMQLWSKPLPGGAAAAVVLNRAAPGGAPADANVRLSELPGLAAREGARVHVRDIWARADLPAALGGGSYSLSVPGGDSRFVVFTPDPGAQEIFA